MILFGILFLYLCGMIPSYAVFNAAERLAQDKFTDTERFLVFGIGLIFWPTVFFCLLVELIFSKINAQIKNWTKL